MLQPCWVCQLSLYINASWATLLTFLPPHPWGAGGLLALCVLPPFNGNIQPKAFQRFFELINVLASNTDDYKHLVLNIIYSVFLSVFTSTCCQVLIFSNVRTIRIFLKFNGCQPPPLWICVPLWFDLYSGNQIATSMTESQKINLWLLSECLPFLGPLGRILEGDSIVLL